VECGAKAKDSSADDNDRGFLGWRSHFPEVDYVQIEPEFTRLYFSSDSSGMSFMLMSGTLAGPNRPNTPYLIDRSARCPRQRWGQEITKNYFSSEQLHVWASSFVLPGETSYYINGVH
jgi:hypothetical protein